MTVDTLSVMRRLEAAGTPRPQAEALADVLRDAESQSLAELATKADLAATTAELKAEIAQLRTEMKAEMAQLRSEFKADLVQLEQRMTIRLGAMMAVAVASMAALVRLL